VTVTVSASNASVRGFFLTVICLRLPPASGGVKKVVRVWLIAIMFLPLVKRHFVKPQPAIARRPPRHFEKVGRHYKGRPAAADEVGDASHGIGKVIVTTWAVVNAVLASARDAALEPAELIDQPLRLRQHDAACIQQRGSVVAGQEREK